MSGRKKRISSKSTHGSSGFEVRVGKTPHNQQDMGSGIALQWLMLWVRSYPHTVGQSLSVNEWLDNNRVHPRVVVFTDQEGRPYPVRFLEIESFNFVAGDPQYCNEWHDEGSGRLVVCRYRDPPAPPMGEPVRLIGPRLASPPPQATKAQLHPSEVHKRSRNSN